MNSKSKLRNLILKISDLQNILYLLKDLIFKLNRNVRKVERNDKMARKSKFKAFFRDQFKCSTCEWNDSV